MRNLALVFGALLLASSSASAQESSQFTYDAQGRLTTAISTGPTSTKQATTTSYTYDAANNRTAENVQLGVVQPPPSFVIGNASAAPGQTLVFEVDKTGSTSATTTVNYATVDGSAVAGRDYTASTGTLTFAPTSAAMMISVPVLAGSPGNSSMTVQLSGAAGATIGAAIGTGTITAPAITSSFSVANASAGAGTQLNFVITRTGNLSTTQSVGYTTRDGTAIAGQDYTPVQSTLSFPPGVGGQSVMVATNVVFYSGTRTFQFNLTSTVGGASISGTGSATGTITGHAPYPPQAANPTFSATTQGQQSYSVAQLIQSSDAATIVSVSPGSGNGTAVITADRQSVTYTTPKVAGSPCRPAPVYTFTAPYTVADTANGQQYSGTITANITAANISGTCQTAVKIK